ncbi:MAG: trans-aconitate methyltransferase [Halovenus sp.]|jgi:trans-aconitate methyltransferase
MNEPDNGETNRWNPDSYDGAHSFVFEYGQDVVDLLEPEAGEQILDLGCGTGHLSAEIAESGADVVGLDAAAEMVETARERYPDCVFVHADARMFPFEDSFDAVFSNAALHWIQDQERVLGGVSDALIPGGRFVAELGGRGNVAAIVDAVRAVAADRGYEVTNPWYFPTIGEYATRLESHGLETQHAVLFDRPTELENGPDGLADWLGMFGDTLLAPIPAPERPAVVSAVTDRLREDLYRNGTWVADYRRLRVVAVKTP